MTRKTDSTDPNSRWRDAPIAPVGPRTPPRQKNSVLPPISPPVPGPPVAKPTAALDHGPAGAGEVVSPAGVLKADTLAVSDEQPAEAPQQGFLARLGSQRNSSLLTSLALHLILLIVLALLTYRIGGNQKGILIEGEISGDAMAATLESVAELEDPDASESQAATVPNQVKVPVTAAAIAASDAIAPSTNVPFEDSAIKDLVAGSASSVAPSNQYLGGGGGMSARTPEGRQQNGDRYGATSESEAAVENALRWLANHQRSDGSWSFDLRLSPCDGRCRHGRKPNDDTPTPATAATGLALLAFMGAGYTSTTGPYQDTVSRGLYYLRSAGVESEHGYDWQQGGSMYGHGIALMAISEALGMSKQNERYDSDLLHYASRGTRFTVIAQHENGSWGYTPGSPGDTTLTGWQILSLIGAKKAGIETRSDTFAKAKEFLMSVRAEPEFQFGYRSPEPEPTTTAIALTLLMYLGQTPGHSVFDAAVDQMAERGPTLNNVYHDYYATMALHHFRHRDWEAWNSKLRDHLVATQETDGHEAGSWHFRDKWGDVGGRLYTTAMCTLTLEVYYRFLPLYEEPPDFPL